MLNKRWGRGYSGLLLSTKPKHILAHTYDGPEVQQLLITILFFHPILGKGVG